MLSIYANTRLISGDGSRSYQESAGACVFERVTEARAFTHKICAIIK